MHDSRDHLAQDEQAALEHGLVRDALAAADEDLNARRCVRANAFAEQGLVGRHIAPTKQRQSFALARFRDDLLDDPASLRITRHEQEPGAVVAEFGQRETKLFAFRLEEAVRDLHQHAATVAGVHIRTNGTAVIEIVQDLQAHRHNVVRLAVLHVGHEADPTGVVLAGWVVEALRFRQAGIEQGAMLCNSQRLRPRAKVRPRGNGSSAQMRSHYRPSLVSTEDNRQHLRQGRSRHLPRMVSEAVLFIFASIAETVEPFKSTLEFWRSPATMPRFDRARQREARSLSQPDASSLVDMARKSSVAGMLPGSPFLRPGSALDCSFLASHVDLLRER